MILGMVVGRAGSKGLPNKNILDLGGKPLVQWAMENGLKSKALDKVIISTDSEAMMDIARNTGIEVPFKRPETLAQDGSLVVDSMKHALEHFDLQGLDFKYVALLQPTSPFTRGEDIDKAVNLAMEKEADTVISGYFGDQLHPSIMFERAEDGRVKWFTDDPARMSNRQKLAPVWLRAGNVYVISTRLIRQRKIYGDKVYSIEIPKRRSLGVDDEFDLNLARYIVENGLMA